MTGALRQIPKVFSVHFRLFRIIVFTFLLLWCAGFSFNAFFPGNSTIIFYPFLKQVYSGVCHQIDYKTFEINNLHLLVCARCSGIYLGALFSVGGLIIFVKKINIPLKYFFISCFPMAFDVILYAAGVYHYTKWLAFSTGILFGSVAIVYILASIENFLFKELNEINEF